MSTRVVATVVPEGFLENCDLVLSPNVGVVEQKGVWELGQPSHHKQLQELLEPFTPDKFFVRSRRTHRKLNSIRKKLDESCNSAGFRAIHQVPQMVGYDEDVLKELLRLGCNPDVRNNYGWSTAHMASWFNLPSAVRLLAKVRPNLKIKNNNGHNLIDAALNGYWGGPGDAVRRSRMEIASIWVSKN